MEVLVTIHKRVGFGDGAAHALGYFPSLIDVSLKLPRPDTHGSEGLSET